jgi:WD40 repeat protein
MDIPGRRRGTGEQYRVGVADVESVASARVGDPVERLVCHPRLPLVAGLVSQRPAVGVWDCGTGQLLELGIVGAESSVYGDAAGWQRFTRTPAVAWHPDQPLLVVASEGTLTRWTPAGLSEVDNLPAAVPYRGLAFSPDGRMLWASPSAGDANDTWNRSDIIDLDSGIVGTGPRWDTGVAVHPAGGLVATLRSDQGATLAVFAQVGQEAAPAPMRVLRRALILDVDGYQTPIFSADGRHLAIRGNAYENSLEVFEFPSLDRVLATTLGEPNPGYPYPEEWLEQLRAWSRHNIAFGAQPGVLWIGTPSGTLTEVNIDGRHAIEHDVLAGSPVTALAATATGDLVVAGAGGELVLLSVGSSSAEHNTSRATVTSFLDGTSEVADDDDFVITDGSRTWQPDDLSEVSTASPTDPTWLQLQAAINTAREQPQ